MKNTPTRYCFFAISLLLLLGIKAEGQGFKNELRFATIGGLENIGVEIQYVRDLTANFAALATLGYHKIDTNLEDFKCSDLISNYSKFGVGAEWRAMGQAKGVFVQANVLFRSVSNKYKAKIPSDGQEGQSCNTSIFNAFGIGLYDNYSTREDYNNVGISGKIGYRLMTKNERFTFTPYFNFASSPIKNTTATLPLNPLSFWSNDPLESVELNAYEEAKLMQFRLGFEFGVRL